MAQVKFILQPTDFSEAATAAHAEACEIARKERAKLVVLHVSDKPVVSYLEKTSELSPEQVQQKLWDTLQWPRECEKGLNVEHRVVEGDAVKRIVGVAREIGADLIVMGTHGPRGMLSWFRTNVTDHVVREAPCSVLVVKELEKVTGEEAALEMASTVP